MTKIFICNFYSRDISLFYTDLEEISVVCDLNEQNNLPLCGSLYKRGTPRVISSETNKITTTFSLIIINSQTELRKTEWERLQNFPPRYKIRRNKSDTLTVVSKEVQSTDEVKMNFINLIYSLW